MRGTVILTMIPLAILVWMAWPRESVIVAKAVATESIRAQRMDATTFRLRWSPVSDLPPAVVKQPQARVASAAPAEASREGPVGEVRPRPARVRHAALRGSNGICARHGMRKVHYGKRWRCRR